MTKVRAGSVICFLAFLTITRARDSADSQDYDDVNHSEDPKTALFGDRLEYSNGGTTASESNPGQRTVADILSSMKPSAGSFSNGGSNLMSQDAQPQIETLDGDSFVKSPYLDETIPDSKSALTQGFAGAPNGVPGIIHQPLSSFSPGQYPLYSGPGTTSTQAHNERDSQFSPGSLLHSDLGSSTVQTQAQVETGNSFPNPRSSPHSLGYRPSGSGLSPYMPGSLSPDLSALSSAQAEEYSHLLNPHSSSSYYPNQNKPELKQLRSGLSSVEAQPEASNLGSNSYHPSYFTELPSPNLGSSFEQVPEQSDTPRRGLYPGTNPYSLGYSQASAQAQAVASSNMINPKGPYTPLVPFVSSSLHSGGSYGIGLQAQNDAISQASSFGVRSRPVPQKDYILLNNIPGGNSIACTRDGEFHFVQTDLSCLVCACVREYGYLTPICVRCSECSNRPEPNFTPTPPPHPGPRPPVPVAVSCSPLPSGQPFQNPLHPCQICICQESINAYGQPDVQIECQNNPQCVLPPDATTLPPIADPSPVPLPLCEKFPQNVMFPHPSDACTLCYCSVSQSEHGYPEELITCQPNTTCTETTSLTLPPVTPEPTVFPPRPVPGSPPGPLPGPSPHESCRPYAPNQPFQHPWDECQTCVCTEAYSVGLITIEVNCFTKKSCCYEYAEPTAFLGGSAGSAVATASANAQSNANHLSSYPSVNYIPSNLQLSGGIQSQASAEATAAAQSQSSQHRNLGANLYPAGIEFLTPVASPGGNQAFVPGQKNAIPGGNQVYGSGLGGFYNAGNQALATADGYNGYQRYPEPGYASAEAETIANIISGYNGYRPNYLPGQNNPLFANYGVHGSQQNVGYLGSKSSEANTMALGNGQANANALLNNVYGDSYPHMPIALNGVSDGPIGVPSAMNSDFYPKLVYDNHVYQTDTGSGDGFGRGQVLQASSNVQSKASALTFLSNRSGAGEEGDGRK